MAQEEGCTAAEVEQRLGIGQGMISRWKRQLAERGEAAFPGKGHLPPHEEEVRQLQRELSRVTRERDLLKKRWPSSQGNGSGTLLLHRRAPHSLECCGDVPCAEGVSESFLRLVS